MWVRTQYNEIHKIDNIYSHNGFVISAIVDDSLPIELARYESEEETLYVLDRLWDHLIEGGNTFRMPMRGFSAVKRI